jgi:putative membrane protein
MKHTVAAGALAMAIAFATTSSAQTGQGQTGTSAAGKSGQAEAQKSAVGRMFESNMAEVQLGRLASERASNAEVKAFAEMMVTHHAQANQELTALAEQLGVQTPDQIDEKHKAVADRLSKLEGAEFDREFMKTMVTSHQATVKELTPLARESKAGSASAKGTAGTSGERTGTAGSAAKPKSVADYAAKTLPIVQRHLKEAQQISAKLGQ